MAKTIQIPTPSKFEEHVFLGMFSNFEGVTFQGLMTQNNGTNHNNSIPVLSIPNLLVTQPSTPPMPDLATQGSVGTQGGSHLGLCDTLGKRFKHYPWTHRCSGMAHQSDFPVDLSKFFFSYGLVAAQRKGRIYWPHPIKDLLATSAYLSSLHWCARVGVALRTHGCHGEELAGPGPVGNANVNANSKSKDDTTQHDVTIANQLYCTFPGVTFAELTIDLQASLGWTLSGACLGEQVKTFVMAFNALVKSIDDPVWPFRKSDRRVHNTVTRYCLPPMAGILANPIFMSREKTMLNVASWFEYCVRVSIGHTKVKGRKHQGFVASSAPGLSWEQAVQSPSRARLRGKVKPTIAKRLELLIENHRQHIIQPRIRKKLTDDLLTDMIKSHNASAYGKQSHCMNLQPIDGKLQCYLCPAYTLVSDAATPNHVRKFFTRRCPGYARADIQSVFDNIPLDCFAEQ